MVAGQGMRDNDARLGEGGETPSLIERAAARLRQKQEHGNRILPDVRPVQSQPPATEGSPSVHIALDMLQEHGYLTPDSMRSRLAEEMRMIKRTVVQTYWFQDVERANLIMVTSAYPGEGKSFVALNLAISLACEVDFHVLLVDADFERPVVFDRLGIGSHPGLMDILKDPSIDMSEIILRTNIERLSLIGPGRHDDMSTELLASQRMQRLAQEMADRYPDRLIIFDTPPLLACSEPAVLAELMGQGVFVVEANNTQKEAVEKAIELVPETCRLGLVLNKSRPSIGSSDYGYYSYKGYRNR